MILRIIKSAFISYVFRRIIKEADYFLFSSSLNESSLVCCNICNSYNTVLYNSVMQHNCLICKQALEIPTAEEPIQYETKYDIKEFTL